MKKVIFKGSGVAIVTPFKEDGSIDYSTFKSLIDFQLENGTDCIVVCGTTGESPTLSEKEKLESIRFVVNQVNGKAAVVAGAGSNNTGKAVEISRKIEALGVDGLLSVTPYYNKTSQAGLIEHYNTIANHVSVPIILYNVPSRTGCNMAPETYQALSEHENICAIKEANSDIAALVKTKALCEDNINIYSGEDALIVPTMALGGLGVISVFANVCPKQCADLTHAMLNKNYEEALKIQLEYNDLINALFCDVNPIPIKAALSLIGFNCGKCRLPLVDLSDEKLINLKNILKKHKLI